MRYNKGLKPEKEWVLESESDVWNEGEDMMLRHNGTGQYLSVTDQVYPDTLQLGDLGHLDDVLEVVGDKPSDAAKWRVVLKRPSSPFEDLGNATTHELYYEGTVQNTNKESEVLNNTQSSMADLQNLHSMELDVLEDISKQDLIYKIVAEEFDKDGYTHEMVIKSDILHPVDSYNVIKRTSRTWKRIIARVENIEKTPDLTQKLEKFSKHCLDWDKSRIAVAMGILHVHQFYDLDTADLVKGVLKDTFRNLTYLSTTRLNVGDVKLFAEVAQDENNIIGAVQWLRLFPQLRKRYSKLVKYHDDLVNYDPRRAIKEKIRVGMDPVEETVFEETDMRRLLKAEQDLCPPFEAELKAGCPNDCLSRTRSPFIHRLCQVWKHNLFKVLKYDLKVLMLP